MRDLRSDLEYFIDLHFDEPIPMCGICGIINLTGQPVNTGEIESMIKAIDHRGPDDRGRFVAGNVGFGHTRLSIIDLSALGHQPMEYDGIVITYNGEIYNFKDIRKSLEGMGYQFQSDSDTEVMIKAYQEWGIKAIEKFNGMFAFSLLDKNKNKLFLVRDRFGVKPLYYIQTQKEIVFASSIPAIRKVRRVSQLSQNAIHDYLNLLYIPGSQSIFSDIQKILPGHFLELDLLSGITSISQYYNLQIDENDDSWDVALQKVESLLNSSVEYRMISDVPVGVFLSGGVDSSLICALASRQTDKRLSTFSIGYGKEGSYFDESQYALAVSKRYNTNHTRFEVNLDQVFTEFDSIVSYLDEPNADTSVFLNFYIAKLARQHVTVALSGVGGDELFGGYNRYQAFLIGQKLLGLPKGMRKAAAMAFGKLGGGRSGMVSNSLRAVNKLLDSVHSDPDKFYAALVSYTKNDDPLMGTLKGDKNLNFWMKHDIDYYLPGDILSLTDQMSMAHALEVREPFLDFRLVEQAMCIPASKKVSLFKKKIILKKLAEKFVDKEIIYRAKRGFSAPVEPWLRKAGPVKLQEEFKKGPLFDFLADTTVSTVMDGFFKENKDLSLQVYSIVLLNEWLTLNLN